MPGLTFIDLVKQAVSVGGTGALTVGAAVTGYQALGAGQDAQRFPYSIEDGTAKETGYGVYTHSGTSFARSERKYSSTGSALNVTTAAFLWVDVIADVMASIDRATQSYITGLLVTKHSGANTLDISAGSCYDPSSGKVINYAGGSGISAGSLGASQWNQVYLYDVAGTATVEVVNNANPPSTCYAGTARQGGTNSNRRWIGSFLTTAASALFDLVAKESSANQLLVSLNGSPAAAPFRILSAGTSTTFVQLTMLGCVPRYATTEALIATYIGSTSGGVQIIISMSTDGTNTNAGQTWLDAQAGGTLYSVTPWLPIETSTPSIYYKLTGTNPQAYLDVFAYKVAR